VTAYSAFTDDELSSWLRSEQERGSNFMRAVSEAAFLADAQAYRTLRPALLRLKEEESRSTTSYVVLDREEEKSHDPSGSRIRCPLCGWSPRKEDHWFCNCGREWNTFDTGGVCPSCLHQWTETQCLSCSGWSAHSDWYAK